MQEKNDHISHNLQAEKRILHDVEKHGFYIALLEGDGYLPAFAYTIGFYKTYGHPEIIIFGLNTRIQNQILHHVREEIRSGAKFKTGINYHQFLSNYPIRFIEVKKEHYRDYLGYCGWFYDKTFNFPVFQLVWTDKEEKFPWEENFYQGLKFKQALLDRNTDFKFYEERNLGVHTTQKALDGSPILWVYHNEDGNWQFQCEENPDIEEVKIVSLECLVKQDPSLNEIHYLNLGQYAARKEVNADWKTFNI